MQQKLLQCCTVQHSDVNMIQRGIVVFFSEKQTVVKQWIHNCGEAGSPCNMLDFVRPILKSHVLKIIYFHQLMG